MIATDKLSQMPLQTEHVDALWYGKLDESFEKSIRHFNAFLCNFTPVADAVFYFFRTLAASPKLNIVHQDGLAQLRPKLERLHESYDFDNTSGPSECCCPNVAMTHTICFSCMRTIRDRLRMYNLPLGTQI